LRKRMRKGGNMRKLFGTLFKTSSGRRDLRLIS